MEREEKLIRKILRRGDRKAAGELVGEVLRRYFLSGSAADWREPGNGAGFDPGYFCEYALLPCPDMTAKKPLSVPGCTVSPPIKSWIGTAPKSTASSGTVFPLRNRKSPVPLTSPAP